MGYFDSDGGAWNADIPLNLLGRHFPLGFGVPASLWGSTIADGSQQVAAFGADPVWEARCQQAFMRCMNRNPNDPRWVTNCGNSLQQCLNTPGISTVFPGGISVR